jgi:hypothetical protein
LGNSTFPGKLGLVDALEKGESRSLYLTTTGFEPTAAIHRRLKGMMHSPQNPSDGAVVLRRKMQGEATSSLHKASQMDQEIQPDD